MGRIASLSGTKDRPTLAALAASRHGVVSTVELLAADLTRKEIHHLVEIGFLHPRHRGVHAVGRPDVSFEGACRAAVLACGDESAISQNTAGRIHRFRQSFGRIHVSGPRSLEGHPGLIVHRPRSLPLDDIVERDGIAVTTVARTLLDMSPGTPVDTIGRWIHEAGVQGVIDLREVWACCERQQHHRGRGRLLAALALEVAPTRSGLEDAFLPLSRRAGLPKPVVNGQLWSGEALEEVDFHYPGLGLIVEVDGDRVHGSRWRRRKDAAKDERFRTVGWTVHRVPELQIVLAPDAVIATLATLGRPLIPVGHARQPNA